MLWIWYKNVTCCYETEYVLNNGIIFLGQKSMVWIKKPKLNLAT